MPYKTPRVIGFGMGVMASLGIIASAQATPINHETSWDGNPNHLYQLFDSIGADSLDTEEEVNNNQLAHDELWSISASGGSVNTIMFEVAGNRNANTFGIYDMLDSDNRVQIFEGNDSSGGLSQGSQRTLSISDSGAVTVYGMDNDDPFYMAGGQFGSGNLFGYYLDGPGGTFFSQQSLNSDFMDHMVSFQGNGEDELSLDGFAAGTWGTNEYILAWEDLAAPNWDWDYNDFVVMVESVMPQVEVPVPATLGIFALGLGLLAARRRQH